MLIKYRYRQIMLFFGRVFLSVLFWHVFLPRLGLGGFTQRTSARRFGTYAQNFRALAVSMGGLLIKVGQFLSARVDVLPLEITDGLAGLQDEVPPEDFAAVRRLAELELGASLEEKFDWFDETPLAAASLGQVHRAHLAGEQVVVKIQRPNIQALIETDLTALRSVGGWLMRFQSIRRRVNVPALLDEFGRVTNQEIDYLAEGRNAEIFRRNFKNRPGVRVPFVIWSHTTSRVLTLQDVLAIKISDYPAISAAGIERKEVAKRLFHTYLQQFFDDGFFHADPHPGNLFVTPLAGKKEADAAPEWELTFVDFGMVGQISQTVRSGLRELVIGIAAQDTQRLMRSYQMLGVLLPGADTRRIEQAEVEMFRQFGGKSMKELRQISLEEIKSFAEQYRQILYDMPFQIPQNLIFLGRTAAILSGLCTALDADFNVWESLQPYERKLIAEEAAEKDLEYWLKEAGVLLQSMLIIPRQVQATLQRIEHGDINARMPRLEAQMSKLDRTMRQAGLSVSFSALLIGGVQLYIAGYHEQSYLLGAGALVALVWILFSRNQETP